MKKMFLLISFASMVLILGACAKNVSTEPLPIPPPPAKPSAEIPGMNAFNSALDDTSYKADKVPPPDQVIQNTVEHQTTQQEAFQEIKVKPTTATEVTPPTVTGQDQAIAKEAGYPLPKQ